MKVNIVSSKLIKPCTSTPPHLKQHKLSLIDQIVPRMNLGVILLYPKHARIHIDRLQQSLSEILPQFYPLAGRYIKNERFIDCGDQGVEFVEAEAVVDDDGFFDTLVSKMDYELLKDLLPCTFHGRIDESPTDPLMSIQVTGFKCGGLAVTVSIFHIVFDAASVGTFVAAWSHKAKNNNNNNNPTATVICPSFESPSLFPGSASQSSLRSPTANADLPSLVVKKFSFNKDAIARLRSKLVGANISRVRVVCAVIAKALIGVDRVKQGGRSRPCVAVQAVNMRRRLIPPLPDHSCGNLLLLSITRCMSEDETNDESAIAIQDNLVAALGDGLAETTADCAQMFSPGGRDGHTVIMGTRENMIRASTGGINRVVFSDWSKFGLYEADFGWGKPVGAGIGSSRQENLTVLMSNKEGDGIEAWVHLNAKDMPYFEQDEDIKFYTLMS